MMQYFLIKEMLYGMTLIKVKYLNKYAYLYLNGTNSK